MAGEVEVQFKVEGLDGLQQRMEQLSKRVQKSLAAKAARKGMALVRDAARARVLRTDLPGDRAEIWRNVVVQESRRGKRLGGVLMRVGVTGGSVTKKGRKRTSGGPGGITRHFRHLELGTQFTKAQPFLRPALENNASAVADTVAEELGHELDRVLPRSPA